MTAPRTVGVLFSSAGRRVELMNCFRADAEALGARLRAVAVDAGPALSAACAAADASRAVPRCDAPDFIPRLLELCAKEKISLVVPTIDTELEVLSAHREEFARLGAEVAVSAPDAVRVARDKGETARFLAGLGVKTPRTAALADFAAARTTWRYPVILKPAGGSSSVGLRVVRSAEEASTFKTDRSDYLAQELREGREYTVNMYFDRSGAARCAVPHRRLEIRGGEVSKGVTERVPALMDAAAKLGAGLKGARGALCFQAILDADGAAWVFEINARFGGGYPLAHRAGATFSRWLLEDALDLPSTAGDSWREGVTMLRYDAAVFTEPAR